MNDLDSILAAIQAWRLSLTHLRIMLAIEKRKLTGPTEIAKLTKLSPAGIGESAGSLVKRGIMRKHRDPEGDERAVIYSLTTYGKAMLQAVENGNLPVPEDSASSAETTPGRNTETPASIP